MKQLTPFAFESHDVRVLADDNGDPLFVAKDVAEALEYTWSGTARIEHVPAEWRGVTSVVTPSGVQEMAVLTEPGLYFFLGRSDKPKALPFQKWAAAEVFPSIRKTGRYEATPAFSLEPGPAPAPRKPDDGPQVQALKLTRLAMQAAKAFGFKGNMAALSADHAVKVITGASPLALMGQTHLTADPRGQTYTPTEIGKLLEPPVSAAKVNRLIETKGLQIHDIKGAWVPTDAARNLCEWLDTNKRHTDGTAVKQLKWFASVVAVLAQEDAA